MRKHGWQLPYHPLQVVAIAVFLALGFAFYVFFLPFVGKKVFEYVVLGIYTPLATCVFGLYVWCGATDPIDPGVFKSKKYRKVKCHAKVCKQMDSRQEGSVNEAHGATSIDKSLDYDITMGITKDSSSRRIEMDRSFLLVLLGWLPLPLLCGWCFPSQHDHRTSEDGVFYCSLCEVEVGKYSKHCRVCDKCVDQFDHHCRWINNCIGRKNYRRFFVLMILALLLLILQWSIGILVLILSFLERKRFSNEIIMKLGSSFSLVPFIVVVASCTFLAMLATLPLAQLFFFHVLLIKKGISTYDYIVALREQDQQGVGQQSPQMSSVSSLTGFSSASSFSAFQRASWCTPPRLFVEDQFDVIHQESNAAVHSVGKKTMADQVRKAGPGNIKINPWTLARLDPEEVSKAAAQARKKSKILQPIITQVTLGPQAEGISDGCRTLQKPDSRRRVSKRGSKPSTELPLGPLAKVSASGSDSNRSFLAAEASSSFAPLQFEARSAFRPSRANTNVVVASSPDSSFDSPEILPFQVCSSINEDLHVPISVSSAAAIMHKATELSRSTSDGYEASGGEDSDRVPSRIVHRPVNWSSLILSSDHGGRHGSGHAG